MFFPIPRGDALTLVVLVALAFIGLLVDWGDRTIAGVAVLAWWMAALMLVSPGIAIARLLVNRSRR